MPCTVMSSAIALTEGLTLNRMRSLSIMVGVNVNWVPKLWNWVLIPETPPIPTAVGTAKLPPAWKLADFPLSVTRFGSARIFV